MHFLFLVLQVQCKCLRLEIMDDDGEGKVDPLVTGIYRLDQLVCIFFNQQILISEQMLAKNNSKQLALQHEKDAGKRHEKAKIEVTTCHFGDENEPHGAGSDEHLVNGSNESIIMRGYSTESDSTLPRHYSEL